MSMQGGALLLVKYVYADVLFAVNLVVNYLILSATGKLSGREIKTWRLLSVSAAGSLYSIAALFAPLSPVFSLPARIGFGLLMVAVSFPGLKGPAFATVATGFYLCSAITAGTAFALLHSSVMRPFRLSFFGEDDGVARWWIVAASLAVLSAFPLVARLGGYRPGRPLPLLSLELAMHGREVGLTALIDTGNNLRDPLSGLPVIVVDWNSVKGIMPGEATAFFRSTWDSIPSGLAWTPVGRRLRLIPFESLSGRKGVLPGFRPDRIVVLGEDGVRIAKEAIVGVSGEPLSPGGLYQALLHPDLVCL